MLELMIIIMIVMSLVGTTLNHGKKRQTFKRLTSGSACCSLPIGIRTYFLDTFGIQNCEKKKQLKKKKSVECTKYLIGHFRILGFELELAYNGG